jgi:hypothetical protein
VSLSRIENGQRVCNSYEGNLSYEAYLTHLLTEVGYSLIYLSPFEKMLEFIHEEDPKMKVLLTLEEGSGWYHFVIYGKVQWCVKSSGDRPFHETGNRVLHAIRESYRLGE